MSVVDFVIVAVYLIASLVLGLMAATTFSVDTPLYIAGVVGTRGIAGNWEWWSFAVAHVLLVCVFARRRQRAAIVTDAELTWASDTPCSRWSR